VRSPSTPRIVSSAPKAASSGGKWLVGSFEQTLPPIVEPWPIVTRPRIVICGGGLAGIAAAVEAAGLGAEVTLVERRPFLGGKAFSFTDRESGREVVVTITPTYSGCPAMDVIRRDVEDAVRAVGFEQVEVRTVLSPAWTTDWITTRGRERLKAYGIAPPSPSATAECPQCGSADTIEVSRFGSTPCKAQWRCNQCLEPFDRFKCH